MSDPDRVQPSSLSSCELHDRAAFLDGRRREHTLGFTTKCLCPIGELGFGSIGGDRDMFYRHPKISCADRLQTLGCHGRWYGKVGKSVFVLYFMKRWCRSRDYQSHVIRIFDLKTRSSHPGSGDCSLNLRENRVKGRRGSLGWYLCLL